MASHAVALWTPPLDGQLRRLRLEGATWAEIGAALGVHADVARERGRRIGAHRPPPQDGLQDAEDIDRPPLPPGHPGSWGRLIAGTTLADLAWPGWG